MVASTMAYSMSGSSEQALKSRTKTSALTQSVSLEDGVPVAEEGGKVTPRTAGTHHPQHRFDEPRVIAAASPGVCRLAQAVRLHLCPLGVSQYDSFHPKLES